MSLKMMIPLQCTMEYGVIFCGQASDLGFFIEQKDKDETLPVNAIFNGALEVIQYYLSRSAYINLQRKHQNDGASAMLESVVHG